VAGLGRLAKGGHDAATRRDCLRPDPPRWKRCRGKEAQEGREFARLTVCGLAEPPVALKGGVRRGSSTCARGNAGEARRPGERRGPGRRSRTRGASRKTGMPPKGMAGSAGPSTALQLAPDPLHVRATPRGRARHPRGCERSGREVGRPSTEAQASRRGSRGREASPGQPERRPGFPGGPNLRRCTT